MRPDPGNLQLRAVAEAAHALRRRRHGAARTPPFEDTLFLVLMVALTLLGESVAGANLLRTAGLAEDRASAERFRKWLGRLVVRHLQGDL
jgi:hypothetical protein